MYPESYILRGGFQLVYRITQLIAFTSAPRILETCGGITSIYQHCCSLESADFTAAFLFIYVLHSGESIFGSRTLIVVSSTPPGYGASTPESTPDAVGVN